MSGPSNQPPKEPNDPIAQEIARLISGEAAPAESQQIDFAELARDALVERRFCQLLDLLNTGLHWPNLTDAISLSLESNRDELLEELRGNRVNGILTHPALALAIRDESKLEAKIQERCEQEKKEALEIFSDRVKFSTIAHDVIDRIVRWPETFRDYDYTIDLTRTPANALAARKELTYLISDVIINSRAKNHRLFKALGEEIRMDGFELGNSPAGMRDTLNKLGFKDVDFLDLFLSVHAGVARAELIKMSLHPIVDDPVKIIEEELCAETTVRKFILSYFNSPWISAIVEAEMDGVFPENPGAPGSSVPGYPMAPPNVRFGVGGQAIDGEDLASPPNEETEE